MNYEQELVKIFKDLTPENQANLLTHAKLAGIAETAVKKSLYEKLAGPVNPQHGMSPRSGGRDK
jgi:hypothetical protein